MSAPVRLSQMDAACAFLDRFQDARQAIELRSLAHIDDKRSSWSFRRLHSEFGEARYQLNWKIVNAVIPKVFERFEGRRFPRAAHTRDDDKLGAVPWFADSPPRDPPHDFLGIAGNHLIGW